ncbi:MAG: C4-dicarboxylate ABC transporter permease, partial [Pseudomonadota bacterium]
MAEHGAECTGFFSPAVENTVSCLDAFKDGGALQWFAGHVFEAPFNVIFALTDPGAWLGWTQDFSELESKQTLMRFIYYGASIEFFFVLVWIFLAVTVAGYFSRRFLWGVVRGMEGTLNWIGRLAAWAGLLMVLQQIMVIFLQSIFRVSDIGIGPAGLGFERPLGWWGDGLKFHNALVVTLCCAYTFVQGGHVRVDLFYANMRHRTKRAFD